MKRLLFILVLGSTLWAGYWFVGAAAATAGFEMWFKARAGEGWQAEYSDLALRGFPNRFDATFSDVTLADPDTGLAWQAPFFQLLTLSYRPNHVIAVWPEDQLIATPLAKYRLASSAMRASLVLEPGTALQLTRANLVSGAMRIVALGQDSTTALTGLRLAAEQVPGDTSSLRLGLSADGLAPPAPFRLQIDPANLLPTSLDALKADVTVTFTRPWDRTAIEQSRPQPTRIAIKLAEARWGELELLAAGTLTVDAAGLPSGRITVKAQNWREILSMAVAAKVLPQSLADTLEQGLSLVAQLSGNPKTLDVPLDFNAGQVSLGPVPLGPAPVMHLR